MRRAGRIVAALAAAMLAAQAPPPPDRQAQVNAAIFDICPRVFDGTLSLTDPAAAAAIGFTPTGVRDTPGGPIPRAERGAGVDRIVIAGQRMPTQRQCSVWFGGPDDARLLKGMEKAAKAAGYKKGGVARLGDGTGIYKLIRSGAAPQTLVVILADGGGELEPGPATTVIYMDDKG